MLMIKCVLPWVVSRVSLLNPRDDRAGSAVQSRILHVRVLRMQHHHPEYPALLDTWKTGFSRLLFVRKKGHARGEFDIEECKILS